MNYWVRTNQLIVWFLLRLYLIITFSKIKVYLHPSSIQKTRGYIVAANHHTNLDPFVLLSAIPLRSLLKLSPLEVMAHRGLFRIIPVRYIMLAWGGFPHQAIANLNYGLPFSSKVLAEKGTIGIFPEGTRVKGERIEAKRGVGVLASEPDVDVILCHLEWRKNILLGLRVIIAEPKNLAGKSAQEILDQIYLLS